MKKFFLLIAVLLVGVLLGFGSAAFMFAKIPDFFTKYIPVKVGVFLDTDFVYLKSGEIMRGQIVAENEKGISLRIPYGSVSFRPEEIARIDRNYYTRYLKEAW